MVNSEFERIMLETMLSVKDEQKNQGERLTAIETQIRTVADAKAGYDKNIKEEADKKYRRFAMVISSISAISGFSFVWNLVHPK